MASLKDYSQLSDKIYDAPATRKINGEWQPTPTHQTSVLISVI